MNRRILMGGLACAASAARLPAAAQDGSGGVGGYESGGRPIVVDWFAAAGRGAAPAPAVLLLHGADGLSAPGRYEPAARALAGVGYHVAFAHYLDSTGDRRVSYGTIARDYPVWRRAVADGVGWLAAQPGVDGGRIGIVGVSLGAALAFSAAASGGGVKAIVDVSGPLPQDVAASRPKLPPTLVLHGSDDRIVPVANARDIEALLKEQGVAHEVTVYPGQGHWLDGPARLDAALRTAAFLKQHL